MCKALQDLVQPNSCFSLPLLCDSSHTHLFSVLCVKFFLNSVSKALSAPLPGTLLLSALCFANAFSSLGKLPLTIQLKSSTLLLSLISFLSFTILLPPWNYAVVFLLVPSLCVLHTHPSAQCPASKSFDKYLNNKYINEWMISEACFTE